MKRQIAHVWSRATLAVFYVGFASWLIGSGTVFNILWPVFALSLTGAIIFYFVDKLTDVERTAVQLLEIPKGDENLEPRRANRNPPLETFGVPTNAPPQPAPNVTMIRKA